MSMTLILWKAPVVREAEEADTLLKCWHDTGDESAFEPSRDIARFLEEIRAHYPDDVESADHLTPWSSLPIPDSDRIIDLSIRWGASDSVIETIWDLARDFGLVLYDPQGPDVHLPDDPIDSGPIPPPTAWEWFKGFAIAAVLCALTYAAWQIPVWWLKWPAVIVAGFMAAAGTFVVGCMIAGILGFIDIEEGRSATCAQDEPPL
jgi:hypothetical protein